jgi:hypothetical protein
MFSIWFLFALLLAAPMYAVWRIQRLGKRELCDSFPSAPQLPSPEIIPEAKVQPAGVMQVKPGRELHRISIRQFMAVIKEHDDVIVVDLRADEKRMLFPVPTAFVLSVIPEELDRVLGWLPADRSIAFWGASTLSILLIVTSPCMEGSGPLYVLEGDLRLAEVA